MASDESQQMTLISSFIGLDAYQTPSQEWKSSVPCAPEDQLPETIRGLDFNLEECEDSSQDEMNGFPITHFGQSDINFIY